MEHFGLSFFRIHISSKYCLTLPANLSQILQKSEENEYLNCLIRTKMMDKSFWLLCSTFFMLFRDSEINLHIPEKICNKWELSCFGCGLNHCILHKETIKTGLSKFSRIIQFFCGVFQRNNNGKPSVSFSKLTSIIL